MDKYRSGLTSQEDLDKMFSLIEEAGSPQALKKHKAKKVVVIASNLVFVLILCFLLTVLIQIQRTKNSGEAPSLFGYYLYYVETGSMEPTIETGAIIVSKKPEDASKLKKGDVVTFKNLNGKNITHRIVQVLFDGNQVSYKTKGDNPQNGIDTEILTPDRVLAVMVFKMPFTGG